ncbi:MAG TPA: hypothetical protein VGM53_13875 [Streptosporangiaceae bacterium]
MIARYLTLVALRGAVRLAGRLLRLAAVAAVLLAAAPVSLVAGYAVALAWLLGWPPRRLCLGAAWCLPMVVVWLAGTALAAGSPGHGPGGAAGVAYTVASAPYHAWLAMWHLAGAGSVAAAAVSIAPAAIPLGLLAGALAWSRRIYSMQAGAGGRSPGSPVTFDVRQWRHQVRSARARIAAPGSVPLVSRGGVVPGAVIRAVGHAQRPVAVLPYRRLRSHQVVIGTTGTGKTTLLLRLWAGFMTAALRRHAAGAGPRPLLVILDCKGGADSRRVADRARRVLRDAGARSTAVWPDEASLSVWALPPGRLTTTLLDLIEHGTGSAAYYADVMESVVSLAVCAPPGPPRSTAEFLARLDQGWLAQAYGDGGHDAELAMVGSAGRQVADVALRFRALFRRLGPGLDGPGGFGDADVWYCILEGTAEIAVAEAQARTLVDLLASYVVPDRAAGMPGPGVGPNGTGPDGTGPERLAGQPPEVLLAVDEFSAVSRRLPVWQLYERARSLGLAVQVSAQSWQGLADDEDERYRIAASADGGIWLLRTPHPDPVVALAGNRSVIDTTRRLLGTPLWGDEGTSRVRHTPVLDPDIVRSLGVGQAAYVYRGGVTFVQVKRLVAAPAALPPPVPAGIAVPAAEAAVTVPAGQAAVTGPAGAVTVPADGMVTGAAGATTVTVPADGAVPVGETGGTAMPAGGLPDAGPLLDQAFGEESR